MHIKMYKDGKILLPLKLRKKLGLKDNSELILTECKDGIKISTRQILLNNLRNEFASINLDGSLSEFRKQEFVLESNHG